ncbi:MAG: hypothetical protein IIX01_06025 [Clostridia bacterium]|nr:hypothetical protein [Clostridia bacterium]
MKKSWKALASLSLGVCMLTACGVDTTTNFTSFWNPTPVNEILPGTYEAYEYDVSLKTKSASNETYSVDYQNGVYKTELSVDPENSDLYLLKTSLTISVAYQYKEQKSEYFSDSVETVVKFKSAQNGLRPVYSEKTMITTSPKTLNADSLESTYARFHYSEKTTYNEKCTSATCERTDFGGKDTGFTEIGSYKKTFSIPQKHTYLDNEQLAFALRGITSTTEQSLSVYNASQRTVQTVKADKDKNKSDVFQFSLNGEAKEYTVDYAETTLKISGINSGDEQVYYIAQKVSENNPYRNMILKIESPISYSLGTLEYRLVKATTFIG